jgi:hypothetical protein
VVGLLALLIVTLDPLSGEDGLQTSANTAQLTALIVAMGTAAVAMVVWAWRTTRISRLEPTDADLAKVKQRLAELMKQQWEEEAKRRSLDVPTSIPVRWRLDARWMDHPSNIEGTTPGTAMSWSISTDDINEIADNFRQTRWRRMAILGDAGTGKTTLAVQLLRKLLQTRNAEEPVPVLLPVAGWDTGAFPALNKWLTERLLQDYAALRSVAPMIRQLAARREILAVLDGLDELPDQARTAVIRALNQPPNNSDPLILTSRTTEYRTAVDAGNVLHCAAVLKARPVEPATAANYLRRCLRPNPGDAWNDILDGLATVRAASPPAARTSLSALSEVAATPLGLWLLRTVYTAPDADPKSLTEPDQVTTTGALRSHLLDQLIPALITTSEPTRDDPAEPFRPRRAHDPANVYRWLSYLAHHLTHPRNPDNTPRTRDFAWWHLARHADVNTRRTGFLIGIKIGAVIMLVNGFAARLKNGLVQGREDWLVDNLAQWLAWVLGYAFVLGLVFAARITFWSHQTPGSTAFRLPRSGRLPTGRFAKRFARGFGAGLLIGSVTGFADGLALGIVPALQIGVMVGLMLGLAFGLLAGLLFTVRPTNALAKRFAVGLLIGFLIGFAVGLKNGLPVGLAIGLALGLLIALLFTVRLTGFVIGLLVGFVAGFLGGVKDGLVHGLLSGLSAGIVFGFVAGIGSRLVSGLSTWLEAPAVETSTPLSSLRGDRALHLVRFIAFGLVGLAFGFMGGKDGPVSSLVFGCAIALAYGFPLALAAGQHHAWIAYLIATRWHARRGLLPRDLMTFLSDAHRLGLLRMVGPVYQFRHAELQDHLAHVYSNPSDQPASKRP